MVMMPEREQTNGSYKKIFCIYWLQELSHWQNAKYKRKRAENFLVSIWNHYDSCADYLDGITDTRIFGGNIMEQKEFVFQAL